MVILQAIQDFGNWFWGIPILILIGGGGLFLTVYLGFPQIRHFGYAMSQTFGKMFAKKEEGKVRPISAAFAALACAVGASNIVGRARGYRPGRPRRCVLDLDPGYLRHVHQVLRGRDGHQVPS